LAPIGVAEYLGLAPTWVDSTTVGGASWEVMASHAADAIAEGRADVVLLAYGSTSRSDLRRGLRAANLDWGSRGPQQWEVAYGHTLISKYAMAARRHMHEFGSTLEQLAEIAVSARANAALNPEAQYREPITIDDVLGGPMVADPFTKLQCCIRSDGGAAAVLVAEDRVADLRKPPVWVLGSAEHTSHVSMSQWADFTTGWLPSGPLAFSRAGVRPADVDEPPARLHLHAADHRRPRLRPRGDGGSRVEGGTPAKGELNNTDAEALPAIRQDLFRSSKQLTAARGVR
jgi:acetyl-CoA acetyltransferase